MNYELYEIMAPVGSRESLAAAINAGADSIYFGIEKLNMRAHSASTFTIEDLREIAATCDAKGIKTYLTVNTIIYGEDIDQMHEIIDAAKEAGISAVIASDVAVMTYCQKVGQEVHLSTQLNISNIEALRFYAQFADVVVLARELRMDQVKAIHKQAVKENICGPSGEPIRIEMFCHGALCMAISGKCYLSLHNAGRSANRGECVQICRRKYDVTDAETGNELLVDNKYIMSPKDLKTIRFIDKMMDAGVRVFKIEGRARGPEYVDTVVRCYREAINAVLHDADSSDEEKLRDEFFVDVTLHDPAAQTDFLMGLDVLPEYRGKGLARELMRLYGIQAQVKGRLRMVLTAHEEKVGMYEKMGFTDLGISGSVWGGNPWHEMEIRLDSRI